MEKSGKTEEMSWEKCQLCAQNTHLADVCPYLCTPCKNFGCNGFRKLITSNSLANPKRKFLRCQALNCTHFQWLDEAILERGVNAASTKASSSSCSTKASSHVGSSTTGCFNCGENDHWMQDCMWKSSECNKEGCLGTRMLKTAGPKAANPGKKYLKCQSCGSFQWLSQAMESSVQKPAMSHSHVQKATNVTSKLEIEDELNKISVKFINNIVFK